MKKTKLGIGFATGRKSFQTVLKTNIYNWKESGLTDKENITLNLFIAYDLKYSNTRSTDYTNVSEKLTDLIDDTCFIGAGFIQREIKELQDAGVLNKEEANVFFTRGYAAKRNAILYFALKNNMDYVAHILKDGGRILRMALPGSCSTIALRLIFVTPILSVVLHSKTCTVCIPVSSR